MATKNAVDIVEVAPTTEKTVWLPFPVYAQRIPPAGDAGPVAPVGPVGPPPGPVAPVIPFNETITISLPAGIGVSVVKMLPETE
jgi:hypothetical protein